MDYRFCVSRRRPASVRFDLKPVGTGRCTEIVAITDRPPVLSPVRSGPVLGPRLIAELLSALDVDRPFVVILQLHSSTRHAAVVRIVSSYSSSCMLLNAGGRHCNYYLSQCRRRFKLIIPGWIRSPIDGVDNTVGQ